MLAAAWGPSIPASCRTPWMIFGALGLAAAVGLDIARRIRRLQTTKRHAQVIEQRVVKVLTPLAATEAEPSKIRETLQRIAEDYQQGAKHSHERRFEPRMPVQIPAHMKPVLADVERRAPKQQGSSEVVISEFSSRGIRLSHKTRLRHGTVILNFDLLDGQSMSLTVQLHWTQHQVDGTFASGGTVLNFCPLASQPTKIFPRARQPEMVQSNS